MIAIVIIASLWLVAGLVIVSATRRPADSAAIALASTTPVVHVAPVTLAS